jgi:carbonic anhydrase/acetyltransferase-like protein (isoleucine patch superfamily)
MALIIPVRGKTPHFGKGVFIAENATVVGDVTCGENCSFWFNAVIRGDVHYIKMGDRVNVQDGAVIHGTYQKSPTNIGSDVSIAHNAVVHGCTIKDRVLIGMGAIVMDDAIIGENSIIAAGSVVKANSVIESNSVYAGIPARKVKTLDESASAAEIERIANNYVMYKQWYRFFPA